VNAHSETLMRCQRLEARVKQLTELLTEVDLELAHCHVFVRTREKIHPDGLKLYHDLQVRISTALANV
jgi:hypothetical protein